MVQRKYNASKTQSDRPGWSVTFNHPLITDSRGVSGVKVRRGLSTRDAEKADELVEQINVMLSDTSWWDRDRRTDAEQLFDTVAVSAFYHGVEDKVRHSRLREEFIPLPTPDDGYARVMLVGLTGAGKTTLLRQLIGSDAKRDRFPSTSTARTTTADIEIVLSDDIYKAVVTFMDEQETRFRVDECVEAACVDVIQGADDGKTINSLLEHREQRFRLSYPLGKWGQANIAEPTGDDRFDMFFDDDEDDTEPLQQDEVIDRDEISENNRKLEGYLAQIKELANTVRHNVIARRGNDYHELKRPIQRQQWLGEFSDILYDEDMFKDLSLTVMDEVQRRFNLIEAGVFERVSPDHWPQLWYYEEPDRETFLKQVRWFSSNHEQQFGRLLTPIVNGVRVSGRFSNSLLEGSEPRRLVLLDGEGLGHTAKESRSISTRVTEKFHEVEMILLVDNAQSPMQADPIEFIRTVGNSGHAYKLGIAFTHFDMVKGDNLRTSYQKRNHVRASIGNALSGLRDQIGAPVAEILERRLENNDFYLGSLDTRTDEMSNIYRKQLRHLMDIMQASAQPIETIDLAPIYETSRLELALRDGTDGFKGPWRGLLGLEYYEGVEKEHWGRIKALCRRIANRMDNDEYAHLKPKSDMLDKMQEAINLWLATPAGWTHPNATVEEQQQVIEAIKRTVYKEIHTLVTNRLVKAQKIEWSEAFNFRGTGSSFERARVMGRIYDNAAPSITSTKDERNQRFLFEVLAIIRRTVEDVGGSMREA